MESYLLGQLIGYVLIWYVFYWLIKKAWTKKINRTLLVHEQIIASIFAIIILAVITGVRVISL